ncbi:DUF4124 domain-containing protein [Saccharospirillum impatiens]|jgi:hypothetical protein|uniref:DUF4124 domain-containing protein n=1 Tax=Saccharospirillum impatiens TaxID=169438 RepID=UPI00041BC71A|nr:DUF4124 domain-containing protein [Saccharospirillum impatiens]
MKQGFLFSATQQVASKIARPTVSLTLAVLLSLSAGSTLAESKIYTWTDAEGTVHYGDRPPRDTQSEEVSIRGQRQAAVEVSAAQLNGTWFGRGPNGGETRIRIQENGAIRFTQTRPDQSIYTYQGIWRLEDRTLSVITEFIEEGGGGTGMQRSVEPVQLTYTFTSFNPESFTLRSQGEDINVSLVN